MRLFKRKKEKNDRRRRSLKKGGQQTLQSFFSNVHSGSQSEFYNFESSHFVPGSCGSLRANNKQSSDLVPNSGSHFAISNRCIASSNKKLLGAKGIATRIKDATSSSWPYY